MKISLSLLIKPNVKKIQARHVLLKMTLISKIFVCITVNGNVSKFMDGMVVAMARIAIVVTNFETLIPILYFV